MQYLLSERIERAAYPPKMRSIDSIQTQCVLEDVKGVTNIFILPPFPSSYNKFVSKNIAYELILFMGIDGEGI